MNAPNTQTVDTDVLIVGAGPVGLVLAIKLRQCGLCPIIVDKLESGHTTSRAAVIHAHTLEVLHEETGVAERLGNSGLKLARFSIRDRDGVLLQLRFDHLPSLTPHLLMLPQDVTETLLQEALQEAGGSVQRGCTAERLTEDEGGVMALVRSSAGLLNIRARYVVGADGIHSMVRGATGIRFRGSSYQESFVLADVEIDPADGRDEVRLFFSPEGLVVVAPLPGKRYRVVATMSDAPQCPDASCIQSLLEARGPRHWSGRVTQVFWSSKFQVQHRLADQYRKGRIFLAGDAAHVHSPAGGQGMNTGIVDACVLGGILADVLTGLKDERHLDLYEALRRPAAMEVLGLAGGLTRMATMKGALQRKLRNSALKTVNQVPFMRRRFEMKLSGLSRRSASKATY